MVGDNLPDKPANLIIIAGPTAVGKTLVAIEVARHFNTEIISADSRQFYQGLNIGTAAPTKEQLSLVKHHFIGHLKLEDYYNVSMFETDVINLLSEKFKDKRNIVLTGGSGLYIRAITDGIDDLPNIDTAIREKLQVINSTEGLPTLRRMLLLYDPEYAQQVDLANPNRIIRALEVCLQTGKSYSSQRLNNKPIRNFNIIRIALDLSRDKLHERINHRVDQMIEECLVEEARAFYPLRNLNSLNTVGYKELFDYFDCKISLEEAIEKIKTNTRRYARRQITWFRKNNEFHWLPPDSEKVIDYLSSIIR